MLQPGIKNPTANSLCSLKGESVFVLFLNDATGCKPAEVVFSSCFRNDVELSR